MSQLVYVITSCVAIHINMPSVAESVASSHILVSGNPLSVKVCKSRQAECKHCHFRQPIAHRTSDDVIQTSTTCQFSLLPQAYLVSNWRRTGFPLGSQWWPSVRPHPRIWRARRPTSILAFPLCSTNLRTLHRTGLKHGELLQTVVYSLLPAISKQVEISLV